ncbi:hypothetical protein [Pseudomonas sp. FME51]|uniref:hypothetical protein n=1 Tax=Pseudomonas sp. FME51 TaxID=2742609 RepID=UPI0018679453|nr:hypothetical protein [Pseudomonas sp. FME51]
MTKIIDKYFGNPSLEERAARQALKDAGQLPVPPVPWIKLTLMFAALITAALFSWGII